MAIAPNSNRAKADMSLAEWEKIKANISDYFV